MLAPDLVHADNVAPATLFAGITFAGGQLSLWISLLGRKFVSAEALVPVLNTGVTEATKQGAAAHAGVWRELAGAARTCVLRLWAVDLGVEDAPVLAVRSALWARLGVGVWAGAVARGANT
jgi:hypothetical protein